MSNKRKLTRTTDELVKAQAVRMAEKKLATPPTSETAQNRDYLTISKRTQDNAGGRLQAAALEHNNAKIHLWMGVSQYKMSDDMLKVAIAGGPKPVMDESNMLGVFVGCYLCEAAFQPALLGTICPGMK